MQNLQSFSLNRMNIESIEQEDFSVFTNLRQLDLSQNALKTIHRNVFDENTGLEAINLSYNPIKHIAHYVFDSLTVLRILDLQNLACINDTANSTAVEALRFSVFLKCPPTSTMIGEEVMNSEKFETIIHGLEDRIEALEEEISDLR